MNAKIAGFSLLLLCSTGAHAVSVRFLAWDESLIGQKIMLMKDKDKGQLIKDLHPLKRSINYQAADNEPLKLHPDGKNNPDGTPAILDVPLNSFTRPLVIVIPNDKAPSGLAAIAIEDNETNFKWGSYMVFNATREDLVMVVDKMPTKIPVGWKPVLITPKKIDGPAGVELRTAKDLKTVVYSMIWQGANDMRRLVIIVPGNDPRLGAYAPKVIPEDKAGVAAEAAAAAKAGNNGNNTPPPSP